MPRVLSLSVPGWATERVARRIAAAPPSRRAERLPPILLREAKGGRELVVKRCPLAARAGVREGGTLAEARALLAPLVPFVADHDPAGDRRALRSLAVLLERFAPVVSLDGPFMSPEDPFMSPEDPFMSPEDPEGRGDPAAGFADGLLLDVTGCAPLFGGEAALLAQVRATVERLGFSARVALAGTAGCARALARFADPPPADPPPTDPAPGPELVVPEGGEADALAPLPVEALARAGDPPDVRAATDALEEIGLRSIGDLLRMPRDEVWARFGATVLTRLDRATGHVSEPLVPVREAPLPHVECAFEGPVRDPAVVRLAVRGLLERLGAVLDARRVAALELSLRVRRADGAVLDEPLRVSRATTDAHHLLSLLDPRLERMQLGDGVDDLRLTAVRTRRLRGVQGSFLKAPEGIAGTRGDVGGASPHRDDLDRALGRLVDAWRGRCGPFGVVAFTPVASHWPERAFARTEPFRRHGGGVGGVGGALDGGMGGDRPSLLLDPPEEAAVERDERGRPATIAWRGPPRRVLHAIGPERLAIPWWQGAAADGPATERDYLRLVDEDGRWLWVFRVGEKSFVHGEWA